VSVRLDCPLCRATVAGGSEPRPGRCPGCGAVYEGGAETAQGAVEALLRAAGVDDVAAAPLTRALFEIDPASPLAARVAITSDRRDGFYRWWVFALPADGDLGTLLRGVPISG
jgi:hypothetical protein